MTSPGHKTRTPAWAGNWSRVMVAAVFGWSTAVYPAMAQAPASPPPPPDVPAAPAAPADTAPDNAPYTQSDLEYLLAPVALYPDPLLAILFPATAFPDQLAEASIWAERNPNTARYGDPSALDSKPWDSSVKALTRFPDVLKQLAEHPEWAESLGYAFIQQPQDVSNTIQMLRAQAEKAGNLATTPQQVVTTQESAGQRTIYIEPASPERIYVPVYDPDTTFNTFAVGALGFGAGVVVGSAWNNRWGWNNRRWNTIWVPPPAWRAPPHWGVGGRPGPRPPNWRPGQRPPNWRPGQRPPYWGNGPWRPGRPGAGQPGVRPPSRPGGGTWPGNRPGDRPGINRPGTRPDNRPGINRPIVAPPVNRPGVNRPDTGRPGVNRPDRPNVNRPGVGPNRPQRPNAGPNRPANRPNAGPNRPQRPNATPQRPANRPAAQRPNVRPQQRPQARPQQRARPQARPQQRARPQQVRPQQRMQQRPNARPQQRARPPANVRRH
ncbi:DUF3300 domain-containing protein [Xanthobacter sediminis]